VSLATPAAEPARSLVAAVARRREQLVELTRALVRERSVLGEEEGAQRIVEERLRALGFDVRRVAIAPPSEREGSTWGYPPLAYAGRTCVAGRIAGAAAARSIHLSGHVDVVPAEAPHTWTHDPWAAELAGGRIWGRGAGDMKGGIAAYLIAAEAYLEARGAPPGDLLFSSVIEEECTGNGMKAVLEAGYDAEATLIGEPSALALMHAGVGVIWARLMAHGGGAHPAFTAGESSSEQILAALSALHELERRLNEPAPGGEGVDAVFFSAHERPFRLNVGVLGGGEWPSSEPAIAQARVRVGFGRSLAPEAAQERVRAAVREAAPEVAVVFEGFRAPAYCDQLEHPLADALASSHEQLHGSRPRRQVLAATTDARSVAGPCVCYGPLAGDIHGTDEWVDVDSLEAVACGVALTMAAWQGASYG
jgi:acetylornithine deacetylase